MEQETETDMEQTKIVLLVPKAHVKHVKSALEKHSHFDRASRITPHVEENNTTEEKTQRMRIPTTIPYFGTEDTDENGSQALTTLLTTLTLTHLSQEITLTHSTTRTPPPQEKNPLRRALATALSTLPPSTLSTLNLTIPSLTTTFPDAYSIYPPMLLLPSGTFSSTPWTTFLTTHPFSSPTATQLWTHIATAMNVTHIALNSPIPPSNAAAPADTENTIRSPLHLTPIHGPWGPEPTPQSTTAPTAQDFADATWVRTCQNGIWQVWAPRYTMFSRGNMREKTRILDMPRRMFESGEGEDGGKERGVAAVDLYAGIGYFSFSYRKRGARVVCWEMNPWSVEGMRRGAEMNGWSVDIVSSPSQLSNTTSSTSTSIIPDFTIHPHSNTTALPSLTSLLSTPKYTPLPPIRHINLGLLPVSRPTWSTALRSLDARTGGWIHAHENVGIVELEERREEVEGEFGRLMREWEDEAGENRGERKRRKVEVVHVERVKLYAPGVVHAVFDVWVEGTG